MSGRLKTSIVILALLFTAGVQTLEANEGTISMDGKTKQDVIIKKEKIHDKIAPKDKKSEKKKSKSQKYYEDLERQKRYFEE